MFFLPRLTNRLFHTFPQSLTRGTVRHSSTSALQRTFRSRSTFIVLCTAVGLVVFSDTLTLVVCDCSSSDQRLLGASLTVHLGTAWFVADFTYHNERHLNCVLISVAMIVILLCYHVVATVASCLLLWALLSDIVTLQVPLQNVLILHLVTTFTRPCIVVLFAYYAMTAYIDRAFYSSFLDAAADVQGTFVPPNVSALANSLYSNTRRAGIHLLPAK